jgi:SAM-dependent methyltransferase
MSNPNNRGDTALCHPTLEDKTMTVSEGARRTFRRICAVCGGTEGDLLYQQRFIKEGNASFLEGYDVVACGTCGFAFADGIPDQQWFDAYYGTMSKYEDSARGGAEPSWETAKMRAVAQAMIPYVPKHSAQIVDIGCSTGRLLANFRDAGFEHVLGVDPSPSCAQMAMQRFGIRVKTGTFSKLILPEGFADVMVLTGVLEHVRDLGQALDKIALHTKMAGRVFISVPNASRYAEGEDAPFQEFSIEHINFLGPGSLTNLMSTRGFVPIAMIEDMLPVNLRTKTPILYGIFCKSEARSSPPFQIIKDKATIGGLINYIAQCRSEDERIRNIVDSLVQENKPLLVWGVGTHTLRLLAESSLGQANIIAFVDKNPRYHGCHVLNLPVLAPKALQDYPDAAVLISTRAYQEEIASEIRQKLQCTNEIVRFYSLAQ